MTEKEILKYLQERGKLDMALVQAEIEMHKRKEILEKHPYEIWEGKDGKWYTYVPDAQKGRLLKKRITKEKLEEYLIQYYSAQEDNPTLEELFSEYNDMRLEAENISQSSHLRYQQEFKQFFGSIGNRKVKSIDAEYLCQYIESLFSSTEMTHKTFTALKALLRGLFILAYRRKYINYNINTDVLDMLLMGDKKFTKTKKAETEDAFSEVEYDQYKSYLTDNLDIWNAALLLILVSGLRGGEIVALTYNDIKIYDTCVEIDVHKTETRYKGPDGEYVYEVRKDAKTLAGNRTVTVPREYSFICRWLLSGGADDDYIFKNPKTGERLTTNSLRRRQERNCKKLGYSQKSPHKGRKTYGSILLDHNADKKIITGQMGHTNIATTEKYYHRDIKSRDKKAEIINSIFSA